MVVIKKKEKKEEDLDSKVEMHDNKLVGLCQGIKPASQKCFAS